MKLWDSFFALVCLENIIVTPLSIAFPHNFHSKDGNGINWLAFEIFLNTLWSINFFININRIDTIRKIISFEKSCYAYLATWLIPDLVALIGAVVALCLGSFDWAKYFSLIRLLRFSDTLYPVDLIVEKYTIGGKKRVKQNQSLIFVFFAFITLGHLAACLWIYFGRMDEHL